jgi:hypothetical protein
MWGVSKTCYGASFAFLCTLYSYSDMKLAYRQIADEDREILPMKHFQKVHMWLVDRTAREECDRDNL